MIATPFYYFSLFSPYYTIKIYFLFGSPFVVDKVTTDDDSTRSWYFESQPS